MRKVVATLAVALPIFTLAAGVAEAAPTEVNVRIEGRSETLFEGPVRTDGHAVQAASDVEAHHCDGTNNGANPTPGPTPTAAGVDAMSILGEGFDGLWYGAPSFDDYFVKRWGPDGQDLAKGEYWGILVNNAFTSVGGCQYQVDQGDEVLWVYDAFGGRPQLALYPVGYSVGTRPLTATAELNQPFEVEVDAFEDDAEEVPPASPERTGANPFPGAEVAPVVTSPKGFESVDVGDPDTVVTGIDGRASIVFDEPGWHRIKATAVTAGGGESAIRSNRLDVCVPEPPATDCGGLPADDQLRVPPPPEGEEPEEPEGPGGENPGGAGTGSPAGGGGQRESQAPLAPAPAAADPARVRLGGLKLDRSRIERGLVRVGWRVLDAGVGIGGWSISSQALGRRGARYVTRATGSSGTAATVRLAPGVAYRLRFTVVDVLGRAAHALIGKVEVPAADARRPRRGG
jgi:uncharacterized protein DUF4430